MPTSQAAQAANGPHLAVHHDQTRSPTSISLLINYQKKRPVWRYGWDCAASPRTSFLNAKFLRGSGERLHETFARVKSKTAEREKEGNVLRERGKKFRTVFTVLLWITVKQSRGLWVIAIAFGSLRSPDLNWGVQLILSGVWRPLKEFLIRLHRTHVSQGVNETRGACLLIEIFSSSRLHMPSSRQPTAQTCKQTNFRAQIPFPINMETSAVIFPPLVRGF